MRQRSGGSKYHRYHSFMLAAAVAIVMLIGMIGVVAPFVPGLTVVLVAAILYGVFGDFGTVGWVSIAVISVLYLLGEILGFVLPGRAAGKAGAPAQSIGIGVLGAIVGFFVIPVFGFMLGGIGALFVAELVRTNSSERAWSTTWATLVGFGISALVQLGFGLGMILTWLIWVIAD